MSKKKKAKRSTYRLDEKVTKRVKALAKMGKNQRFIAKALNIAQSSVSRHFNVGRKAPLRPGTRKKGDQKKVKKVAKRITKKVAPKRIAPAAPLNGSGQPVAA